MSIDPAITQRRASDPQSSVWVAASAGTGKTKVLTDRVISLLLSGTRPERILCLTFTKAAAAEMANRIAKRLADWAVWDDARLTADLLVLRGTPPDRGDLATARRLFARLLDAPGGFHIETIHAFCQSLLRRFPLEAGLAPHFQVMDDRDSGEVLAAAQEEVIAAARSAFNPDLADALALVTARVHETTFPDLMKTLSSERGRLRRLIERHGGSIRAVGRALRDCLGIAAEETAESVLTAACAEGGFDRPGLIAALNAMMQGSKTDQEKAEALAAWLSATPAERLAGFEVWCAIFLTGSGTIRAALCTKGVEQKWAGTLAVLQIEAERVLALQDRLRSVAVAEATQALLQLGKAMLEAYESHKSRRAMLDYDDLILAAVDLLSRDGLAAWVLYKLDGGIDHVLIDEAQDTNPDQWAVVRLLTAEFFAGRGRSEEGTRTVFAVGDAKQSIYSFQGADPTAYDDMRRLLEVVVPAAHGRWDEVPLDISFRSAPAVLQAVDAVFAHAPGRDGVVRGEGVLHHEPWRVGAAGRVEIWPPLLPSPQDTPEPWKPPVEAGGNDNPRSRLAGLMAKRIHAMISHGEMLESKGRPIRAGDILVLVRRRNAFVDELVRALKARGVPVAGADRMVLTEQLAVMDLMALGNVLLLPEDDLTLATVLKGPLVGLSEDQLFALAWNRDGSLWQRLKSRSSEAPFARVYDYLSDLAGRADQMAPHDLYAHVLTHGGKERLLARLGPEAEDPLDEFMALTLAYERLHPPSLQGFLRWLEEGGIEIKRDMDQDGGAARIMTVHGAKGLQAPIVFLPDTLQVPSKGPRLFWLGEEDDHLLAWAPAKADQDPACRAAKETAAQARDEEYRRLLYVAMTRAEDRLYICGWATRRAAPPTCWYHLIKDALVPLPHCLRVPEPLLARETEDGMVWRLDNPQTGPLEAGGADAAPTGTTPLPPWATAVPAPEPTPPRPLFPSRPDDDGPAAVSPLGSRGHNGMSDRVAVGRGRLIHRLLELLPEVAPPRRAAAARRFLARTAADLPEQLQQAVLNDVLAILDDSRLAALFGPGSRAEVPLVGRWGDRVVSGQVDRLVVTENAVLVVDYKTGVKPPGKTDNIPLAYVKQMAAYRAVLTTLYPTRTIRCALLWTTGPHLTILPDDF